MPKRIFPQGRLWNKLSLTFTVAMTTILLVFSPLVYMTTENKMGQLNQIHNQQVMAQMGYNIQLMNNTVRDLCMTIFLDADAMGLLYSKEKDAHIFDAIQRMNKITGPYLNVNPYVHSIYLYNGSRDTFYSSYNGIYYQDQPLLDYLKNNSAPPINRPIYRQIAKTVNQKEVYSPVFTYILYDALLPDGRMEAAVIINVNPSWIMGNLSAVNDIGESIKDSISLVDPNNHIITSSESFPYQEDIHMILNGINQEALSGETDIVLKGDRHHVLYLRIPEEGWTIYKIQPQINWIHNAYSIRIFIMIITILFVLLSILLALTLSRRIYRPIGNLVREVAGLEGGSGTPQDEIGFLKEFLLHCQMAPQETERQNSAIYKNYTFRTLLLDGGVSSNVPLTEAEQFAVDLNGPFLLAIAKVDRYQIFKQAFSPRERNAIFFAICNVIEELVSPDCRCDVFDLQENSIVLLAQKKDGGCASNDFLPSVFSESQAVFRKHFRISLTFAVTGQPCTLKNLPAEYQLLQTLLEYRFICGYGQILTAHLLENRLEPEKIANQLVLLQQNLLQAVSFGEIERCRKEFPIF